MLSAARSASIVIGHLLPGMHERLKNHQSDFRFKNLQQFENHAVG